MATLLTVSGGYTRISNMFSGNETTGAFTPEMGSSTSQWKSDTTYWGDFWGCLCVIKRQRGELGRK